MTASGGNSTFAGVDGGNAGTITVTTNAATVTLDKTSITAAGGHPGNGADLGDGNNILFNRSAGVSTVILAGGGLTTISTGTTGGNISFTNNLLRSTANEPLTLTSGTGDITFGKNVGAGTAAQALGKVIISNANNFSTVNNTHYSNRNCPDCSWYWHIHKLRSNYYHFRWCKNSK